MTNTGIAFLCLLFLMLGFVLGGLIGCGISIDEFMYKYKAENQKLMSRLEKAIRYCVIVRDCEKFGSKPYLIAKDVIDLLEGK